MLLCDCFLLWEEFELGEGLNHDMIRFYFPFHIKQHTNCPFNSLTASTKTCRHAVLGVKGRMASSTIRQKVREYGELDR